MPPRKTARINGRTWRIEVTDTLPGCLGLCDHAERKIFLLRGSTGQMQDTLFHELTHAACPTLTEEQVAEVERGVFAFLADNPALRDWLFSESK